MPSNITASDIGLALKGRRSGKNWMVRCPAHEGSRPNLSIADGDNGQPLLHCFANCSFREIRDALARLGLWPGPSRPLDPVEMVRRQAERAARDAAERQQRQAEAQELWSRRRPIAGSMAEHYLRGRGLELPPDGWPGTIGFGWYKSASGRHWPALLAAAARWPERLVAAVQVTALKAIGGIVTKAWSQPARLTIGPIEGAAVRLAPWSLDQPVIITEGVEDALAVLQAMPEAVPWAALGAGNAQAVILPDGVDVLLCLDGDDAGRKGADSAKPAFWARGHRARSIELPPGFDPLSLAVAS